MNSSNSTSFHHSFLGTKKAVNLYIKFSRGANPTRDHIKRTLKDLDPVLENDFLALLGDNDSLKSLVETRNKVAHGQSDTCTRRQAIEKGDLAIKIGDWFLENLF